MSAGLLLIFLPGGTAANPPGGLKALPPGTRRCQDPAPEAAAAAAAAAGGGVGGALLLVQTAAHALRMRQEPPAHRLHARPFQNLCVLGCRSCTTRVGRTRKWKKTQSDQMTMGANTASIDRNCERGERREESTLSRGGGAVRSRGA